MAFYLRNSDDLYARFDILDGFSKECHLEYATSFFDRSDAERYKAFINNDNDYDYEYDIVEIKVAAIAKETKVEPKKDQDKYVWYIKDKNEPSDDAKYYVANKADYWDYRVNATKFCSRREAADMIKSRDLNYGSVNAVVVKVKVR